MKIIADTHCHTLASTHAYSTLTEVARAASEKGLLAVGITDHGKTMPGAPGKWYFHNLSAVPDSLFGVRVLRGIEANIIDFDGELDETPSILEELEWVLVSMHGPTMPAGRKDDYTRAYLRVAENPRVHVIGHCGTEDFRFDYERVLPVFSEKGKLVEINSHSLSTRRGARENCREIALLCKKYRVPIVVNSDAHFHASVGEVEEALRMLDAIDFPEELVANSSRERFERYLRTHTKVNL